MLTLVVMMLTQENGPVRNVWSKDRFDAAGKITLEMAGRILRRDASIEMTERVRLRLEEERRTVRFKMKDEIHELLRMGADITKMTCSSADNRRSRACVTTKDMRESFMNDGGPHNIKCIHWIFSELPHATHQDVLPQRKSHMDLSVEKVERSMGMTWAASNVECSQRNCLQLCCAKMLNDKRQTAIKEEGSSHGRKPMMRLPKSVTGGGKNSKVYYWWSKEKGRQMVSAESKACFH